MIGGAWVLRSEGESRDDFIGVIRLDVLSPKRDKSAFYEHTASENV